jgi:hypothetical protein
MRETINGEKLAFHAPMVTCYIFDCNQDSWKTPIKINLKAVYYDYKNRSILPKTLILV